MHKLIFWVYWTVNLIIQPDIQPDVDNLSGTLQIIINFKCKIIYTSQYSNALFSLDKAVLLRFK